MKTYFTGAVPDAWLFFLGALFILVTLYFPKGIVGALESRRGSPKGLLPVEAHNHA